MSTFRIFHQRAETARENWNGDAELARGAFVLTATYLPDALAVPQFEAHTPATHGYYFAGRVEASNFEEAYKATQNIEGERVPQKWWREGHRSTMVGDIIASEQGTVAVVAAAGFRNLFDGKALDPFGEEHGAITLHDTVVYVSRES